MRKHQNSKLKTGKFSPIIVIGGSAGGLTAVTHLIKQFDTKWKISAFVVLHLAQKSIGDFLIHRLQMHTSYKCKLAEDNEKIKVNHIYIGRPNVHLLIKKGSIVIGHGPPENRWRPSIDVLFRSAAVAYGPRVVGIILTGLLDDGTSGMLTIKKSGGLAIVQSPKEAEFPDMPNSVINNTDVDYIANIEEMGKIINNIVELPSPEKVEIPADIIAEAKISEHVSTTVDDVKEIAEQSTLNCPDCGGGLWEIKEGKLKRYRCHIGHEYSQKDLAVRQTEAAESTLWVALRMMEERKNLMTKIVNENTARNMVKTTAIYKKNISDINVHITRIKEILFDLQRD